MTAALLDADIGAHDRSTHDVALQRSRGEVRLGFARRVGRTCLSELYQQGSAKARPMRLDNAGFRDVILLNTSGGLTAGDRYACGVSWGEGAAAMVASQAAERIYRSRGTPAELATRLAAAAGARAVWAPQETILFDGGRYRRSTEIDVAPGGELIACESIVFGRAAMGETVRAGGVEETWRVRSGGRLVYADGFRLDGDIEGALARPAVAGGASAVATALYVGPRAALLRDRARAALEGLDVTAGCSARLGVAVVRVLASTAIALRGALMATLEALIGALASGDAAGESPGLPRAWRL